MNHSTKKGFSFGLTSGVITTLGLVVGLYSSTHSAIIVIGGIITIAIADSASDALGIHISEEAENKHTTREIWESTIATFLSKFIFALSFIPSFLLFSINAAIIISIVYGLLLIIIFSVYLARQQKIKFYKPVLEHLLIAVLVITITYYTGNLLASFS